ncbi:RNaseH [Paracoccus phage ParMal1]|uniref:RNaseH n=1 Tax=Paracoccus phage ParMal1 TaxID=3032416 RepID=A0AAF0FNT4_9CAUD|nr:RNaseH [Paracoccus phage ParMal1]
MSDALAKFGVDAATVASLQPQEPQYPKEVSGRVAHIDADFMAYQVSAESKAELDPDDPTPRKTLDDMRHNAFQAVDHIRRMAAAERAVLHTTHQSNKGGRDDQAILKPYQANRADRDNRPEHLDTIREWLASGVGDSGGVFQGCNHTDQEADDGMTQAIYADRDNAILCSADKDLLMVPGWKLDMYTGKITNQKDEFGFIAIDDSKSSKKVVGRGTKFFWAQLLMGDAADNISGLPECPGVMWQQYAGTKAYKDTYAQWIAADDKAVADKLDEKLAKLTAKTKKCGPVLTFQLLEGARNDKECWETVKACYEHLVKDHGYVYRHWQTGAEVTPTQALFSEMQLLWMRRSKDPNDVLHWLKEVLK